MCSIYHGESDGESDGESVKKCMVEVLRACVRKKTFAKVSVWVCRGLELGLD